MVKTLPADSNLRGLYEVDDITVACMEGSERCDVFCTNYTPSVAGLAQQVTVEEGRRTRAAPEWARGLRQVTGRPPVGDEEPRWTTERQEPREALWDRTPLLSPGPRAGQMLLPGSPAARDPQEPASHSGPRGRAPHPELSLWGTASILSTKEKIISVHFLNI